MTHRMETTIDARDLTALAERTFAGTSRVWIAPEIPPAEEAQARAAHAVHLPEGERVLVLHAAGGAAEGFLATSERFCWRNLGENPRQIGWDELRPEMVHAGKATLWLAEGLVAASLEVAPRLAGFLTAAADVARRRGEGPYRQAPRVDDPAEPGVIPVKRVIALAREHLGEVPTVLYAPSISAARVRQVRNACAPYLDSEDTIAVIHGAVVEGQDGPGFVITGRQLYLLGVGRAMRHWHWRHLEPHTVRLHDDQAYVMGVAVPLELSFTDRVHAQIAMLFRRLAKEAGGEDVT